ncbi:MAG: PQQ-binding-like beta-propeller repeat protein, partial [Thaumarchaeota archaeon]|nr:PQQ-binding-like beta-propeller repeat protein [Nitrososphaerota archaeon]
MPQGLYGASRLSSAISMSPRDSRAGRNHADRFVEKSRRLLLSTSLIAILLSTVFLIAIPLVPPVSAQRQQVEGANWEYGHYDAWGSGFNPQTQITKDNVNQVELKWTWPIPVPRLKQGPFGSQVPILVKDGIAYLQTNEYHMFALDAKDGRLVWSFIQDINASQLPPGRSFHNHMFNLVGDTIYFISPNNGCTIFALDALTGKAKWDLKGLCENIPGAYIKGGLGTRGVPDQPPFFVSWPPVVWPEQDVMVVFISATGSNMGRGVHRGYSLSTRQLLWTWFAIPSQVEAERAADPDWSFREASKALRGGNVPPELIRGDWGTKGPIGGGGNWGHASLDKETGIVYMGSGQASPDYIGIHRPGPNLFAASILAFEAKTGRLVWYFSASPHDLGDHECSWGTSLANVKIQGQDRKVVIQGCKNGYLYVLDAATGKPVYVVESPGRARLNEPENLPFNKVDYDWDRWAKEIRNKGYAGPGPEGVPYVQCPGPTGGIESRVAIAYNTAFTVNQNVCRLIRGFYKLEEIGVGRGLGDIGGTAPGYPQNSTAFALDLDTGKIKWTFFMPAGFHGSTIVSGKVVYLASRDGNLYALNADDGKTLFKKSFGTPLPVGPTIAADADGKMKILQI